MKALKNVERLKLVLAAVGVALFLYSIRIGHETLRVASIVIVGVAYLLRFIRRRQQAADDQLPSEMR